jgi:two-component system sensor histidine kinase DctS
MATIRSYATGLQNMLGEGLGSNNRTNEAIGAIDDAAERASRIVKGVHSFAKRSEPRLELLTVRQVITDTLALLEPELRNAHMLVELRLQPALPQVRADRVLIEQVLVNLVRNSVDAMRETPADRRRLLVSASWPGEEGRMRFEVEDWGSGIEPSVAEKLFTPLLTTKPNGMGMGLTICRSIIELHGSRIAYRPADHGGAIFSFWLPVQEAEQ